MRKTMILTFWLIALASCQATTSIKKNEIVDANHFYSEEHSKYSYKIDQLQKGRPIAVVIKPSENNGYTNKVTLTITTGDTKK